MSCLCECMWCQCEHCPKSKEIADLQAEVIKLQQDLRWIPVEESLPEMDELIWTYEEDDNMDEQYRYNSGWYAGMDKKFNWYTGVDYGEPVPTAHDNEYTWSFTHWMRVIRKGGKNE